MKNIPDTNEIFPNEYKTSCYIKNVIAAYSVATKDVAPYSVVGGNPAGFIKKRFHEEFMTLPLQLKWWDYAPDDLTELFPLLRAPDLDSVQKQLQQKLLKAKQ